MADLSASITQNQITATTKAEAKLNALEKIAHAASHRAKAEASALAAIQARIERDALAVERAIERETIETMSMQTTLARIQADDAAITLASKRIQAEISETTAIYSRLEDSSNEPDNDQNWGDTTPGKTKVAESVDDLQEHSMPTVRNEPAEENLPAYA